MRHALLISLVLLFCALAAQAQETEKRINEILNPNKNSVSSYQDKSYYGGKTFQTSGAFAVRQYSFNQSYAPMTFSTKSFTSNSFAEGNSKFGTTSANTKGRYEIPNISKSVETKTQETKTADESGKLYASKGYDTKTFQPQGKTQRALDAENKPKKPMTIDEVRELLNKNK